MHDLYPSLRPRNLFYLCYCMKAPWQNSWLTEMCVSVRKHVWNVCADKLGWSIIYLNISQYLSSAKILYVYDFVDICVSVFAYACGFDSMCLSVLLELRLCGCVYACVSVRGDCRRHFPSIRNNATWQFWITLLAIQGHSPHHKHTCIHASNNLCFFIAYRDISWQNCFIPIAKK